MKKQKNMFQKKISINLKKVKISDLSDRDLKMTVKEGKKWH